MYLFTLCLGVGHSSALTFITVCIERGTLLDPGGGIVSLEEPQRHTFHCLFDVGICIDSGFAVLGPKDEETGLHSIGYRIEDTDAVVEAGRALGKAGSYPLCDTCTNTDDDGPLDNYKATVKGVVSELGDGTAGEPTGAPLISNVQMLDESIGCPEPTPAPQSDEPTSKPSLSPVTESPTKAPITLPPIPPFLPVPTSDAPITSQPTISIPATDAPVITTSQPTLLTTDEPTQPPVAKQTDSPATAEEVTTTTTEATVINEEETTTTTTDATSTAGIEEEEEEMEEPTMNDPTPAPTEWWQKEGGTDSSNSENSSAQVLCSSFSLLLGALAVMYFHL